MGDKVNRSKISIVLPTCLFGLVLLAGCASSSPETSQTKVSTVHNAAVDDPVVCKRFVPTGSHTPRTFCRRQSFWDERTRVAKEIARVLNSAGPPTLSRQ